MANWVDIQIGLRVRKFRTAASIDMPAAAKICGQTLHEYQRSERGLRQFKPKELFNLSNAFGVGLWDFFLDEAWN